MLTFLFEDKKIYFQNKENFVYLSKKNTFASSFVYFQWSSLDNSF